MYIKCNPNVYCVSAIPANYLPPSKTPCLDALGYCVKLRLGAEQSAEDLVEGRVSIFDCEQLLQYIKHFCPKASQTSNDEYRVKALKRWFTGIPTKKARLSGNSFEIQMKVRCCVRASVSMRAQCHSLTRNVSVSCSRSLRGGAPFRRHSKESTHGRQEAMKMRWMHQKRVNTTADRCTHLPSTQFKSTPCKYVLTAWLVYIYIINDHIVFQSVQRERGVLCPRSRRGRSA
jgi:hypothetical protein